MQREARSCVRKGRDAVEMQRDRQTGLPLKRVRSVLGGVEPAPSSVSALRRCPVKRRRRVLKPFRREEGSSRAIDPQKRLIPAAGGRLAGVRAPRIKAGGPKLDVSCGPLRAEPSASENGHSPRRWVCRTPRNGPRASLTGRTQTSRCTGTCAHSAGTELRGQEGGVRLGVPSPWRSLSPRAPEATEQLQRATPGHSWHQLQSASVRQMLRLLAVARSKLALLIT